MNYRTFMTREDGTVEWEAGNDPFLITDGLVTESEKDGDILLIGERRLKRVGYGGSNPVDGNLWVYIEEDDPRVPFWTIDFLKAQNGRLREALAFAVSKGFTSIFDYEVGDFVCPYCKSTEPSDGKHAGFCPVSVLQEVNHQ